MYILEMMSHFLLLYIRAHTLGTVDREDDYSDSDDINGSSNSSRNKGRGKDTHWILYTALCVSGVTSLTPHSIFMV